MSQPNNMTRLDVVDIETLEVKKAIYLAGHNAQEIQAMSDSLLRNLNTFQFFVRSTPSAAPVVVAAEEEGLPRLANEEIDLVWQSMPGGPDHWLKGFGYQNFAKAIEDEVLLNVERCRASRQVVAPAAQGA